MDITTMGAIDCDVHPTVPRIEALLPYFDDFWRDSIVDRGIQNLDTTSYPPNAPLSARPDWRDEKGNAADTVTKLQTHALDRWKLRAAIGNCIYGVHMVVSEDMAAAFARAVNDWMVKEWLDREPRLRASIVVPRAESRTRCGRDRPLRARPALRAGAAARDGGDAAWAPALLADLCGRRDGTACRSASTPAAATAIR